MATVKYSQANGIQTQLEKKMLPFYYIATLVLCCLSSKSPKCIEESYDNEQLQRTDFTFQSVLLKTAY